MKNVVGSEWHEDLYHEDRAVSCCVLVVVEKRDVGGCGKTHHLMFSRSGIRKERNNLKISVIV